MLQNFNPINLDIKPESEKEREMVKFMWDVCLPHEFVTFILKQNSFDIISQPNVTYKKQMRLLKHIYLKMEIELISLNIK